MRTVGELIRAGGSKQHVVTGSRRLRLAGNGMPPEPANGVPAVPANRCTDRGIADSVATALPLISRAPPRCYDARMSVRLASIRLGAAVSTALATAPVAAQEPPLRFELTPYTGYRIGGEFEPRSTPDGIDCLDGRNLELHEGNAAGLILDILTREGNTQWEALLRSPGYRARDSTLVCRRADARHRRQLFSIRRHLPLRRKTATTRCRSSR